MRHRRTTVQNLFLFAAVMLILLFSLFPFAQILSTSLKHPYDWGNPSLIPVKFNFDAYKELLGLTKPQPDIPDSIKKLLEKPELTQDQKKNILSRFTSSADIFPFPRYFLNTFLLSAAAAGIALFLSVFGAYALSRIPFKGRVVIQRSILFVYMVGGVLLMVPLYQMSVRLGLAATTAGSLFSLLLIYLVQTLPVSLYMLGNYFRTIPYALEEAAAIDGCSPLQTIFVIIIPLSLPMLVTVFVYCFIIAWNEFLFASVFLKQYKEWHTLPLALRSLFFSKNAIWDRIMAASVLTLLPVVICFFFAIRHLTHGLKEGGVKE